MKAENASYLAHGIIWLGVLIAAILGVCFQGNPVTMVTIVLFGILGTFSVLVINNVGARRKDNENSDASQPGTGKKTAAERLTELKELLDRGMITKEEFDRKKSEIVGSI
jgi:uncharacterized membrane protein